MRLALGIEYDGSGFHGWQTQKGVGTIQRAVESALTAVADHPVRAQCAGRTDSGVHACAQVIHFETTSVRRERGWLLGANANLPSTVSVLWVRPVTDEFHARYSATARLYRYVIANRMARNGLWSRKVTWECRALDVEAMAIAAAGLIGEHDFSSFRGAECQAKNPVRRLSRLKVARLGDLIFVDAEANGFLHHMVRNIVGVLVAIGRHERSIAWARQVLNARDRTQAGVTAPADGLYLVGVRYPAHYALPEPIQSLPFEPHDTSRAIPVPNAAYRG
ncbi:MAG: tRNA pseudouridine(38-40) synthase TruA [Gammaproteobacteria bacterium]